MDKHVFVVNEPVCMHSGDPVAACNERKRCNRECSHHGLVDNQQKLVVNPAQNCDCNCSSCDKQEECDDADDMTANVGPAVPSDAEEQQFAPFGRSPTEYLDEDGDVKPQALPKRTAQSDRESQFADFGLPHEYLEEETIPNPNPTAQSDRESRFADF